MKKKIGNKRNKQSNFSKLSLFHPNKYRFKRPCPLSAKGAPAIDYKNIKLLRKYISENGKILPSLHSYLRKWKEIMQKMGNSCSTRRFSTKILHKLHRKWKNIDNFHTQTSKMEFHFVGNGL